MISSEHYSIRTNDRCGFNSGESIHQCPRESWHTISFLLGKMPNWMQILPWIQKFYAKGGIQNHYDYQIHFQKGALPCIWINHIDLTAWLMQWHSKANHRSILSALRRQIRPPAIPPPPRAVSCSSQDTPCPCNAMCSHIMTCRSFPPFWRRRLLGLKRILPAWNRR